MECQTPIRDTERQGNSSEVAGSGPKSQVRSPPPCEWAIRQQWEVVPCPSLGGACPIRGEQKEIRRTAGNSKSSPGGRGMDHFPGNYANWALSLPGKHRSIETAAYAANASSTKGAALDSMYETAQRQCGRAGPVWKWSFKRIDIIRVEYLYEFCRAQFLFTGARWTECNSLPTIAHRPRGRAVPRPARWMGHPPTMGCAARWIAAATHERKLSAQWHASRRQFGVRRREEEEAERKRRGGGRVPVWRAHRWIRARCVVPS